MRLQRSRHLLSYAVLGVSLLLSACGFQLRGTGTDDIKLNELQVSTWDSHSPAHQQILDALRNSGVAVRSSAPYHLQLLDESKFRSGGGYGRRSTPTEYELTHQLKYQISNSAGQALIGPETLSTYRAYVSDQDNLVGSSEEEALLQREMYQDLTRQLMLRLSRLSADDLAARERALEQPVD